MKENLIYELAHESTLLLRLRKACTLTNQALSADRGHEAIDTGC